MDRQIFEKYFECSIAELIKVARLAAGLSQERLADLIGVNQGNLSKWEAGKCVPDANVFLTILMVCGNET